MTTSLAFEPDQRPANFVTIDPSDPLKINVETNDENNIGDYMVTVMAEANGVMDSGVLSPLSFDLMVMMASPACEVDEVDVTIDAMTVYYIGE